MICTNCGFENPGYAVVCEHCGAFLPREDLTGTKKDRTLADPPVSTQEESIPAAPEVKDESVPDPLRERKGPTVPEPVKPEAKPVPKGMIRCRNCWTDNPRDAIHCTSCGKELHSAETRASADAAYSALIRQKNAKINCVNCGAELPWSALTCSSCGKHPRVVQRDSYEEDEGSPIADLIDLAMKIRPSNPPRYRASDWVLREAPEDKPWINYSTARKVRCTKCLELNEPGSTTCRFCGAAITAATLAKSAGRKLCTCGYKNLPKVTVCLNCGGMILKEKVVEDTGRKECTCGYRNLPGVTVCLMCKGQILKTCGKCGHRNQPGADICEKCKTPFLKDQNND